MASQCDTCGNYAYDEEDESYYCAAGGMDEDDYARLMYGGPRTSCPYYVSDDEYKIVRHQM
jgi:hypothetical protein